MDERVDVWVVRSNNIPPYLFWGFQQLQDVEIEGVIHQAKAVLFLGGSKSQDNSTEMAKAVEKVLFWFPDMQPSQIQQVSPTTPELVWLVLTCLTFGILIKIGSY